MANRIFLGNPPPNIKQWIIDHYKSKIVKPLKFTALGQTCVTLNWIENIPGSMPDVSLVFKTSGDADWLDYNVGQQVNLNDGDIVEFKAGEGGNSEFSDPDNYFRFDIGNLTASLTADVNVEGDITTLLEPDGGVEDLTPRGSFVFQSLFEMADTSAAGVLDASGLILPSMTLAEGCYAFLFYADVRLINASFTLPATDIKEANRCYYGTFGNCSNLDIGPNILATSIRDANEDTDQFEMCFQSCTRLRRFNVAFAVDQLEPPETIPFSAFDAWLMGAGDGIDSPMIGVKDPIVWKQVLDTTLGYGTSTVPDYYVIETWTPPSK